MPPHGIILTRNIPSTEQHQYMNTVRVTGAVMACAHMCWMQMQADAVAAELQPKEEQLEHLQATIDAQVGDKVMHSTA